MHCMPTRFSIHRRTSDGRRTVKEPETTIKAGSRKKRLMIRYIDWCKWNRFRLGSICIANWAREMSLNVFSVRQMNHNPFWICSAFLRAPALVLLLQQHQTISIKEPVLHLFVFRPHGRPCSAQTSAQPLTVPRIEHTFGALHMCDVCRFVYWNCYFNWNFVARARRRREMGRYREHELRERRNAGESCLFPGNGLPIFRWATLFMYISHGGKLNGSIRSLHNRIYVK